MTPLFSFRAIALATITSCAVAQAQTYDLIRKLNIVQGTVKAMVQKGDTLFIGGDFTYVSQPRSFGMIVSAADGSPNRVADRPDWNVTATVPDGLGGWFVAGDFTWYNNEPRSGLAHMGGDGHLTDWMPEIPLTGASGVLAIDNGWVFTAGNDEITAVNAITGANIGWSVPMFGGVMSMAAHNGTLYVGGNFTLIGNEARTYLAAIDIATGDVTPWAVSCNAMVRTLLATPNSLVVGGAFSTIAGSNRHGICALNYATALCTPMNPDANLGGIVRALASRNDTLYFGGEFTTISGTARASLAAVNLTTGELLDWDAPTNAAVHSLCVLGDLVMVGGEFSTLAGELRPHLGAVNAVTGEVDPWYTPAPDGSVDALAPSGDGQLFIGGEFQSTGGDLRIGLAAISMSTGELLPWRHDATNGGVKTLVLAGNKLFLGGDFSYVDGIPQQNGAAINLDTDQLEPWYPVFSNFVNTMVVHGSRLYVGGYFTFVNGQPRHRMVSFDLPTLELTGWDPLVGGLFEVKAFGFYENLAYIGHSDGMTVADTASSLIMPFTPQLEFGEVRCLTERNGTMYFGGTFALVNGETHNRAAAVDAGTGVLTAWQPTAPTGGGEVNAIAASPASIFIGGILYDAVGALDDGVVAVDPITGAQQSTNDAFSQTDVHTLLVANSTLYVGGGNYNAFHSPRYGLAGYGINDLTTAFPERHDTDSDTNLATLWPMPYLSGALQFEIADGDGRAPKKVELLDASGRAIGTLRCTMTPTTGHGTSRGSLFGMDELDPAPGLYFVRMTFPTSVRVARMVVER